MKDFLLQTPKTNLIVPEFLEQFNGMRKKT